MQVFLSNLFNKVDALFSLEYFLLISAHLIVLSYVSYKIAQLRNRNPGSDDDDDGGSGLDSPPPKLDLPPGIILPDEVPDELEMMPA